MDENSSRSIGALRSWWILQRMAFRGASANRGNLILTMVGSIVLQGTQLAFIGVLLGAFGAIGGWKTSDIALLFGLRMIAHGICTPVFGEHLNSAHVIRNGEWDRYLVRPVGPLIQLITRWFDAGSLGDLVLGIGVTVAAVGSMDREFPAAVWIYLLLAVLSGALTEAGIQFTISGLDFRWGPTRSLKLFIDQLMSNTGAYPISIFGPVGVVILTFVIPLAFIAYLPVAAVLGRADEMLIPNMLVWLSPLAGVFIFAFGVSFFGFMSRFYVSPGS